MSRRRPKDSDGRRNGSRADALFLAFMFLGLGIGIAYGNAGAGLLIGLGVGLLARVFSNPKMRPHLANTLSVASYILLLMGFYFIFLAVTLIYKISFFYPYSAAIPIVIVGLVLILIALTKK